MDEKFLVFTINAFQSFSSYLHKKEGRMIAGKTKGRSP